MMLTFDVDTQFKMTFLKIYPSAPLGMDSKKLPLINLQREEI
jgi:hypothetical protein